MSGFGEIMQDIGYAFAGCGGLFFLWFLADCCAWSEAEERNRGLQSSLLANQSGAGRSTKRVILKEGGSCARMRDFQDVDAETRGAITPFQYKIVRCVMWYGGSISHAWCLQITMLICWGGLAALYIFLGQMIINEDADDRRLSDCDPSYESCPSSSSNYGAYGGGGSTFVFIVVVGRRYAGKAAQRMRLIAELDKIGAGPCGRITFDYEGDALTMRYPDVSRAPRDEFHAVGAPRPVAPMPPPPVAPLAPVVTPTPIVTATPVVVVAEPVKPSPAATSSTSNAHSDGLSAQIASLRAKEAAAVAQRDYQRAEICALRVKELEAAGRRDFAAAQEAAQAANDLEANINTVV